jgi:hypothetical protein
MAALPPSVAVNVDVKTIIEDALDPHLVRRLGWRHGVVLIRAELVEASLSRVG